MKQEEFEEIVKLIKGAIINENILKAEIRHKQNELEKIQENKMKLILAIANKDLYLSIFKGEKNEINK